MRSTSLRTWASTMPGRLASSHSFSIGRSSARASSSSVGPDGVAGSMGSDFFRDEANPAKADAALAAALSPTSVS